MVEEHPKDHREDQRIQGMSNYRQDQHNDCKEVVFWDGGICASAVITSIYVQQFFSEDHCVDWKYLKKLTGMKYHY